MFHQTSQKASLPSTGANKTMAISVRVECYSGYKADQRPVRFVLGGRTLEVHSLEDQWYSPSCMYFRVIASDGNSYILRHDEAQDVWTLEVFEVKESL